LQILVPAALLVLASSPLAAGQQDDPAARLKELEKRLDEQAREMETLRAAILPAQQPTRTTAQEVENALRERNQGKGIDVTFDDNGLRFKGLDGNIDAQVGGRFLLHGRFLDKDTDEQSTADTFFVRQARLEVEGIFFKEWDFKVQADFPTGTTSNTSGTLQDAWIGWKGVPEFAIRFGQAKVPFSQEETCSTRFIDFVERSLLNRLTPQRDVGFFAYGKLGEGFFEWEAAFYNGTGRALTDSNDSKDYAARLRLTPFRTSESAAVKGLRVGVAGTFGDHNNALADVSTVSTATRFVDFDGTVTNDGDLARLGGELSWLVGPFGLKAEWAQADIDVHEPGATSEKTEATAWYAAATYLLTGEDKTLEGRIVPKAAFNVKEGTFGAWELAARVSALEFDDEIVSNGWVTPANTSD
jgi:phosphate-selective porin OprO/OprP